MLVWLASYPRSGNTMFRMMLHQVFGCTTYAKHYSEQRARNRTRTDPGARPLPGPWPEVYASMRDDRNCVYMVKTHDAPEDDQPAIYVVRNGMAATRSYRHYLRDFNGLEFTLDQVILGMPLFGSWGGHLDRWNPLERPNTLLLKYEDLVAKPDKEFDRVAEFIRMPRQGEWKNNFQALQAVDPKMYRQGPGVSPDKEFSETQRQLFWALHADWMARFGYSEPGFVTPRELRTILREQLQMTGEKGREATRSHRRGPLLQTWFNNAKEFMSRRPVDRPGTSIRSA